MKVGKGPAVVVLGVIAVFVVTLGVFRLEASSYPKDSPIVEGGAAQASIALRDAILDRTELAEFDREKVAKLVDRASALCVVRDKGGVDDYLELVGRWGGTYRYGGDADVSPEAVAYGESLKRRWLSEDHEFAVRSRAYGEATVRLRGSGQPNEAAHSPSLGSGWVANSTFTTIDYDDDVRALVREGTDVVEVVTPVTLNNGVRREEAIVFLWSQQEQEWLPYLFIERQERDDPSDQVALYPKFF